MIDIFDTLYTTNQAAEYLGVRPVTLRHHIYVTHEIKPRRVGKNLYFTRADLDAFQAIRRPGGRPARKDK